LHPRLWQTLAMAAIGYCGPWWCKPSYSQFQTSAPSD